MPRIRAISKPSKAKIALLGLLLAILTTSSSVILTIYPQHLFIDSATKISSISFTDNNKAIIKGNQVSFNNGDLLPLEGREYIRITGNQQQFGDKLLVSATRVLTTTIFQNTLFERDIGSFYDSQVAQINIDNNIINIIPISSDLMKIKTKDDDYNIEFSQGISYITSKNDIMLKLSKNKNKINIKLIGLKSYAYISVNII